MIINQSEYDGLYLALEKGKKFAMLQNSIISLAIAPAVTPFEQWFVNENERLASFNKRLCKLCLSVIDAITNVCYCMSEKGTGRNQHALVGNNAERRARLMEEVRKITAKMSAPRVVAAQDEADFYTDDETGERMYS